MHCYKVSKIAKTCPLKLKDNKNFPRAFSLSITSVTDPNFIAIKLSTWIIECLYWNPHLVHCYHQLIRCIWWGTARSGRTRRRLRPIAGHKPPPTISQQNTSWSLETLSQSFQRTLFFCFCVHSRSRVRECGRRARRVCPHRSAFPDWRGPRTVPSGPSVSVRWRTQVLFRNRNKMKRHRAFQNLYSEANRILWVIESMTSSTMNLKLIHSATSRY